MSAFQFQQFKIEQKQSAFKVGTDSVLLGSWASPHTATQILDIGTGTGLLALMMAQKTAPSLTPITAIELDAASAAEAKANVEASPWSNRVTVIPESLQKFAENGSGEFDFLISNPPYFTTKTLAPDPRSAQARNTFSLPFAELVSGAARLLNTDGRFCLILPVNEALEVVELARAQNLILRRRCRVFSLPKESSEKRHLLEFQKTEALNVEIVCEETRLIIETEKKNHYTEEYRELTKDFYLRPKIPIDLNK